MAYGFQTFRASGVVDLDTNTITSRVLGSVTLTAAATTTYDVPVSTGKTIWYFVVPSGDVNADVYQIDAVTYPNRFTVQKNSASGSLHVFYGER